MDTNRLTDEDFSCFVKALTSKDTNECSIALTTLGSRRADTCYDERLLPYIEALSSDTRPCLFSVPVTFAEIRYLAAICLSAWYHKLKINKKVQLVGMVKPISVHDIELLAERERVRVKGTGIEGSLQQFEQLRSLSKLKRFGTQF